MDGDPVLDAAQLTAPVGDRGGRGLPLPHPAVDGRREEGDRGGPVVGERREVGVLVVDALGKPDPVVVQEVQPVQLAGRDGVVEELRQCAQPRHGALRGVQLGLPDRRFLGVEVDPQRPARRDVRTRGHRRGQQFLARLERQLVIRVEEHHVLAGGGHDAVVARSADAAAVLRALDDLYAAVTGGEFPGDGEGPVDGGVVDDDHLDVAVRLRESGPQGPAESGARVVGRNDHRNSEERRVGRRTHRTDPSFSAQ